MQAEIIVKLESMEPCNSVKVLFFFLRALPTVVPRKRKNNALNYFCIFPQEQQNVSPFTNTHKHKHKHSRTQDRIGFSMIDEAEKRGDISPGNFSKDEKKTSIAFFFSFFKNQLNTRLTTQVQFVVFSWWSLTISKPVSLVNAPRTKTAAKAPATHATQHRTKPNAAVRAAPLTKLPKLQGISLTKPSTR
jgi:hypothetical protein